MLEIDLKVSGAKPEWGNVLVGLLHFQLHHDKLGTRKVVLHTFGIFFHVKMVAITTKKWIRLIKLRT
jgi:hypothetical protein